MKKLIFLLTSAFICTSSMAKSPNVLVIMADDLGYGDLSCYGAENLPTPNIDKLANEGVKFTAGYTSASTCTPTRFSFLTGIYAFRQKGTGIAPPNAPSIIKEETVTFPKLLKKAGYKTAIIGKWHLGLGVKKPDWNGELKPGPIEHGFDFSFILPTTNDRVPSVYVENHRVKNLDPNDPMDVPNKPRAGERNGIDNRDTLKLDWSRNHNQSIHNGISRIGWFYGGHAARFRDEDMAFDFLAQAKQWIKANKDEKFFMYYASQNVHVPRMPNEKFQGKSPYGLRSDATLEFDWTVGELVRILKEENLFENTLIVICSDNGPVLDDGYKDGAVKKLGNLKPSGQYRAGKYSPYEGGARTPFIAYWKGKIVPQISDLPISTIDLGKTICNITGAEVADDELIDSIDLTGTLLGQKDAKERPFVFFEGVNSYTYRVKDWKVIEFGNPKKAKIFPTFTREANLPTLELFNVKDDPTESKNLFNEDNEIAKDLAQKLNKLMEKRF